MIGLLDLANAYCEPILKKQCEQIIRHGITVQNVAMLYAASIKFEAKVSYAFFIGKSLPLAVTTGFSLVHLFVYFVAVLKQMSSRTRATIV